MRNFREFLESVGTGVGSVAGLTGEPPVKKFKRNRKQVLRRHIERSEKRLWKGKKEDG